MELFKKLLDTTRINRLGLNFNTSLTNVIVIVYENYLINYSSGGKLGVLYKLPYLVVTSKKYKNSQRNIQND